MSTRLIDGPEANYMTLAEVSHEVGLSAKSIRRLMARGVFPRPAQQSKGRGNSLWTWRQILYWHMRVEMLPYLHRDKKTGIPTAPNLPVDPPQPTRSPANQKPGRVRPVE